MKEQDFRKHQKRALGFLRKAHLPVTPAEARSMEIADFGLGDLKHFGLELVVYENNDRYCAKELVLFPGQICPEHRHPPLNDQNPGKRETFRCRWGKVYLYVDGPPTPRPKGRVPAGSKKYFTVWHEIVLKPGDQYTLPSDTLHWFQAGPQGAVVSEFSSTSDDASDMFTDPNVKRLPVIEV
ncbi:MAG: D-lyxose ketol-isomerase [Bacteroidetes bacterium]|jgi:D-lyxose ketol-isomerase|nr:D-lyxose ketol-isomerase [Bacteroidota bacterium]